MARPSIARSTLALAGFFAVSGVVHLVKPEFYEPIMPAWVPTHREVILGSGVAEIALRRRPAAPATRKVAGWASVAAAARRLPGATCKMAPTRRHGQAPASRSAPCPAAAAAADDQRSRACEAARGLTDHGYDRGRRPEVSVGPFARSPSLQRTVARSGSSDPLTSRSRWVSSSRRRSGRTQSGRVASQQRAVDLVAPAPRGSGPRPSERMRDRGHPLAVGADGVDALACTTSRAGCAAWTACRATPQPPS